jgi:hypothetical protein
MASKPNLEQLDNITTNSGDKGGRWGPCIKPLVNKKVSLIYFYLYIIYGTTCPKKTRNWMLDVVSPFSFHGRYGLWGLNNLQFFFSFFFLINNDRSLKKRKGAQPQYKRSIHENP